MRYIKNGAVAADPFVYVEGDEPVPPDVPAIVSADWLLAASKQQLQSRSALLGVSWPNDRRRKRSRALPSPSRLGCA